MECFYILYFTYLYIYFTLFVYLASPDASHLDVVDQLLAADLAVLHRFHALHDALESLAVLVQGDLVGLHLAVGKELGSVVDERLGEFKLLGHGGELHVVDEGEGFAEAEVG